MPGSPSASVAAARATKAALARRRPSTDPAVQDADRILRTARLEEYIARNLAAAPPLAPEQLERLALLFQQPAASEGVAA